MSRHASITIALHPLHLLVACRGSFTAYDSKPGRKRWRS